MGDIAESTAPEEALNRHRGSIKHLNRIESIIQPTAPEDLDINIVDGLLRSQERSKTVFSRRDILHKLFVGIGIIRGEGNVSNNRLKSC